MKKLLLLGIFAMLGLSVLANGVVSSTSATDEETIYMVVDQKPVFPGGMEALLKFIGTNIVLPAEIDNQSMPARTVCQCVIEKDGTVSNVRVMRSSGSALLDAEAVRVISSMPAWQPGQIQGNPVRVKYTIPIQFIAE